jgi:chemotaxis signal transduction protein
MEKNQSLNDLFLISIISDELFGIPVSFVREIVAIPKISKMPDSQADIRGIINLRNSIIPVIDMRVRLGKISCIDETETYIQMMNDRESDHRNWLRELEQSVQNKRPFHLETDPHKCAFGKWYYAYNANSSFNQCASLNMMLTKFEGPHDRIHEIAKKIEDMQKTDKFDEAMSLIEKTRNSELVKMIDLFGEAKTIIREHGRELAIVAEVNGIKVAMAVDAVESIEHLNQNKDDKACDIKIGVGQGIIKEIKQRLNDDKLVMILNLENLCAFDDF